MEEGVDAAEEGCEGEGEGEEEEEDAVSDSSELASFCAFDADIVSFKYVL